VQGATVRFEHRMPSFVALVARNRRGAKGERVAATSNFTRSLRASPPAPFAAAAGALSCSSMTRRCPEVHRITLRSVARPYIAQGLPHPAARRFRPSTFICCLARRSVFQAHTPADKRSPLRASAEEPTADPFAMKTPRFRRLRSFRLRARKAGEAGVRPRLAHRLRRLRQLPSDAAAKVSNGWTCRVGR
jgi:hypothetical protein